MAKPRSKPSTSFSSTPAPATSSNPPGKPCKKKIPLEPRPRDTARRPSCRTHSPLRPHHLLRIHARVPLSPGPWLLFPTPSSPLKHLLHHRHRPSIQMPARMPVCCVCLTELLARLPVQRVLQQRGSLKEIFVTTDGKVFSEIPHPLSTCAITDYFAAQQITLEEGQPAEAGLEACDWITEIARRLDRGFVLTIDYGHEAADLFDAHHQSGTVLSYAKHQASNNLYAPPGQQDLTTHVNFTALRQRGARHGLETLGLLTQTAFLLALGKGNDFADLYDNGMDEPGRVRARLQLKTLMYPEGLGERFQVLLQHKNVPQAQLTALNPL